MPSPFWARHADRRPFLLGRMRIAAALRQFFAARDFVEVETGTLVPSPGNEAHLHAFASDLVSPAGTRERLYLRTSPEFACKKLLAAGERRIVEFARSFRNRERGVLHHPEFTLDRVVPRERALRGADGRLRGHSRACGARRPAPRRFSFRDRVIDPFAAPERLAVVQAFARYAGIDLMAVLPPEPAVRFAAAAAAAGIRTAADDNWGDIFSRVLVEKIEPRLGLGRATILYEYPAVQSPLARPSPFRPTACRTVRALCLRGRTRERIRRAHRCGRAAQAARGANGGEGPDLRRALSDRRGVSRRACGDAAGKRSSARLRSTGDAGDRRHPHRAGAVDADVRKLNDRNEREGNDAGALSQRHVALRAEGEGGPRREGARLGKPPPRAARGGAPAALVPQAQPPRRGADPHRWREGHPRIRTSSSNISTSAIPIRRWRRRMPTAAPGCACGPNSSTRMSTMPRPRS